MKAVGLYTVLKFLSEGMQHDRLQLILTAEGA